MNLQIFNKCISLNCLGICLVNPVVKKKNTKDLIFNSTYKITKKKNGLTLWGLVVYYLINICISHILIAMKTKTTKTTKLYRTKTKTKLKKSIKPKPKCRNPLPKPKSNTFIIVIINFL